MEIINVIEIVSGVVTSVESFPVPGPSANIEAFKGIRETAVEKAEQMFRDKAMERGCTIVDDAVDNGNWDDLNGYEVLIMWSNVNI